MVKEQKIRQILDEIGADARFTAMYTGREQFSARVMQALGEVERDKFVPEGLRDKAYENRPLPIGHQQTISQPYIVALMTDLLDTEPDHKVLEIGTGSGYQAAVLSKLVKEVYSVERVTELAESARQRLAELGYDNVHVRCDDGNKGWSEAAPFDAIIVTAAATEMPESLVEQLAPGGRMIIPIGQRWGHQELKLVTKDKQGKLLTRDVLGVAFVPLLEGKT
ncbi:MAG: protein-L-isoaspartate(D-aspartate) O-methyltransferase [Gammaproteobacteria bacterium]|nr:protein-L-isoaspartate(D-aspartate) O-methyltransferase [Gammaproteobacteria bacterium]